METMRWRHRRQKPIYYSFVASELMRKQNHWTTSPSLLSKHLNKHLSRQKDDKKDEFVGKPYQVGHMLVAQSQITYVVRCMQPTERGLC